jgi:hypothetical protein
MIRLEISATWTFSIRTLSKIGLTVETSSAPEAA